MTWIVTALGALVSRSFLLFTGVFSFLIAQRMALLTAYIVVSGTLFLATSASIKLTVEALRVSMPPILASSTYFLPSSINSFIAAIVVVRLTHAVWRWTQTNLATYAGVSTGRSSLMNV